MTRQAGYRVANVDAVLVLEAPKIAAYRDEMRKNIGSALDLEPDAVGVKATTTDGLGAIGRGEGAACTAVALVEPADG
jgi:2-C-methyl-D-erythritol 2,4-cyclodiphosphate synthase